MIGQPQLRTGVRAFSAGDLPHPVWPFLGTEPGRFRRGRHPGGEFGDLGPRRPHRTWLAGHAPLRDQQGSHRPGRPRSRDRAAPCPGHRPRGPGATAPAPPRARGPGQRPGPPRAPTTHPRTRSATHGRHREQDLIPRYASPAECLPAQSELDRRKPTSSKQDGHFRALQASAATRVMKSRG